MDSWEDIFGLRLLLTTRIRRIHNHNLTADYQGLS